MNTIYSRIIWEELNFKDYKIHEEPFEKTENLIIGWIKDNPIEKVNEVFNELSWLHSVTDEGYYDGQFFGLNQRKKEDRNKHEDGTTKADILIHHCALEPFMFFTAIKTGVSPESFEFVAKLLRAYYEKLPKKVNSCNIVEREQGTEL